MNTGYASPHQPPDRSGHQQPIDLSQITPVPATVLVVLARDVSYGTSVILESNGATSSLRFLREGQPEYSIPLSAAEFDTLRCAVAEEASKGVKAEIEGKWAVTDVNALLCGVDASGLRVTPIQQGYAVIGDNGAEVRVRRKEVQGSPSFVLTVKGDGTLVRGEGEIALSSARFYDLMRLFVEDREVEKVRSAIEIANGRTLELDRYIRAGTQRAPDGEFLSEATVEVEFPTVAEYKSFRESLPPGFGRELTTDKAFKNKSLAVKGFPQT